MFSMFMSTKSAIAETISPPVRKQSNYTQPKDTVGLLVTDEFEKAVADCKTKVAEIVDDCQRRNMKFRDVEYDVENDRESCLGDLYGAQKYNAAVDVQRVTEILDKPTLFKGDAEPGDITQGNLGDCWFLSALSAVATTPGLINKLCVAYDTEVGVYGFIFFRDSYWVTVIIDDLLYTAVPKFEELSQDEKDLYHDDKDKYNSIARKSGKGLYFARSAQEGRPTTWVPLIEKAYAKLHGDYESLIGGSTGEGIEDLTGGISTLMSPKDILNRDRFWREELCKVYKDRLFSVSYRTVSTERSHLTFSPTVQGLVGDHAYSVVRAVETRGKRFVIIRNPWGKNEWTGPWSDGSKEWTKEWLEALPELGHTFGADGQFVMEYKDFLTCWDQIDRVVLFDSRWIMSSHWLNVTARPLPSIWGYGDLSFKISLRKPSPVVIVLSQIDNRYFHWIVGRSQWAIDFVLYRKGESKVLGKGNKTNFISRSAVLDLELDEGDYIVHARIDRRYIAGMPKDYYGKIAPMWDQRKLAKVLSQRAKSFSIASNFDLKEEVKNLGVPEAVLAGVDLTELENRANQANDKVLKRAGVGGMALDGGGLCLTTAVSGEVTATTTGTFAIENTINNSNQGQNSLTCEREALYGKDGDDDDRSISGSSSNPGDGQGRPPTANVAPPNGDPPPNDTLSDDSVYLGLRVYSFKDAPVTITGQLRHEMETSFQNLALEENWFSKLVWPRFGSNRTHKPSRAKNESSRVVDEIC